MVLLVHKFRLKLDGLIRLGSRLLLDLLDLNDLVIFLVFNGLSLFDDSTGLLESHGESLLDLDQRDEDLIDKAHISRFSESI